MVLIEKTMKHKNIFKCLTVLCVASAALVSCSDPEDVQDLVLDRVLSPTDITARITNNTDIIVSWNEMTGASYYEIEAYADNNDYDNSNPAVTTTTTLTADTLTGLIGETDYYIRVRAIDGNNESRNSKWTEIMRTTNPEQNMNKAKSADINATSVTLTWTPGIEVEKIVCTPTAANAQSGPVEYTLSAEEIAAGKATVTGLASETAYRATLMLGSKTRGYATFTTNIDFSDAVQLSPSDDWVAAIEGAAAGTKFALAPGTYDNHAAKLQVNANIMIGAQSSADLPVINGCIHINNGASLLLSQVILDGTGTDGSQAIEFKSTGAFGDLTLKGCEVRNYTKGFIYINIAAIPDNITIDNCLVHDIVCDGGDFIDSRKGGWNNLSITSTTFYNCAMKRDVLRADASGVSASMNTTIDRCTFYNVGSGGTNNRFFYLRLTPNSTTFTNNVVANFKNTRGFANSSSVTAPTYKNNYYYNCANLMSLAEGNSQTGVTCFDTEGTALDANPFKDADNGDFTITDELLQSYQFGDPRWY